MALVKAYTYIGVGIQKPYLRAAMENDIKAVCNGEKDAGQIYEEMKNEMKNIYNSVLSKLDMMKVFLENYLNENQNLEESFEYKRTRNANKHTQIAENKKGKKKIQNVNSS